MIGNIITEMRLEGFENFFKTQNDLNDIDLSVPTLIVGWGLLKRLYPDREFSILNKKIEDNLYWTFSRNEKRTEQEKDFLLFYDYILEDVFKKNNYFSLNIFKQRFSSIKKIINLIKSDKKIYIYSYMGEMLYFYFDNAIMGISLNEIEYLGINSEKIYKLIKSGKNNHIFYDDKFLPLNLKNKLLNKKMFIPYFYSLKE